MRKLLLILTMLVSLTGLTSRADETVWTFDKTPVASGTVELTQANAAQYLPDGWINLSQDGDFLIDADNGEGGQPALGGGNNTMWWAYKDNVLAFPVKAGKLSFNCKINPAQSQIYIALFKINKDGDTYSVGDEIKDGYFGDSDLSQDAYTWLDFDIEEDGYVGFSLGNKGLILSVKNTVAGGGDEPGGLVTDTWAFDKTPVSGKTYLQTSNYENYLPDGWHLFGTYAYSINPTLGVDGKPAFVGATSFSKDNAVALPVKAGTLSFNLKITTAARYENLPFALYNVTKDGDNWVIGEEIFNKTYEAPELSTTEFTWVDFDIPADGYIAFAVGNSGILLEVKNTYEGGATPPADVTTDSWAFDKTPVTSKIYLQTSNYENYLPDGWHLFGTYAYSINPTLGADGKPAFVGATSFGKDNAVALPVKAGTLSFNLKITTAARYENLPFALYNVTKDGDNWVIGEEIFNKTYEAPELSTTEFTWVDFDIPADGYIAYVVGNSGILLEVRNTYEAAAGPTYSVNGVVFDNGMNPVEGALVSLGSNTTLSDANGAWTLTGVPVGVHTLTASKDGYIESSLQVNVVESDLWMTNFIINPIESTIKGHLMDEIDYSTVYGKLTFSDADGNVYATAETTAENPDYEVVFKGAVPASFSVAVEAKYYKGYTHSWAPAVGQVYTRNFTVGRLPLTVNVKPVDADGNPVTGAKVTMTVKENPDETLTLNESGAGNYAPSGRFYAHVAADREYIVTVEHPDYQTYTSESVVFDGESKTIEPVLAALAPTVFKGVVKSALDEEPLADATVSISLPDTPTALATVTTGPDGTYSLSLDGALEAAYVLSISADYFEPELIDITEPERGKEYINDAVLKAVMLSFTARVENEAGEAIEGAVLSFNGADLEAAEGVYTTEVPSFGSYWNEYAVKVSATGYEPQEENIIFNGMPVEKVYTLKEIMLTYTAKVVNEAGDAIEDAVVTFDGTELTAADGAYSTQISYNAAADKTFAVEVSAKGYKTQTVEVAFDGKDVTATYTLEQAMLTFTAIVADDEYEPMEGVTATMTDGENTWTLNEDGPGMYSISLPALDADGKTFTVTVSKEGYLTADAYTFTFEGEDHSKAFYMEKDESGIANIGAAADGTLRVFDINGRRINVESVNELPAGFYIINGVKTAIR